MNIFVLSDELFFPPVELSSEEGILAIGGDLSPERLLLAYSSGVFPWYSENEPIIWWSPDPRFILFPNEIKISKSMKKFLKKNPYTLTVDTCFKEIITKCREVRLAQEGTWITNEMLDAYCRLHEKGFAHSVEVRHEGKLIGGLYGISLGKCFFGESMFSLMPNASKAALIFLNTGLIEKGFHFIDCQVYTKHLETLGAKNIPREVFISLLEKGLDAPTLKGSWTSLFK